MAINSVADYSILEILSEINSKNGTTFKPEEVDIRFISKTGSKIVIEVVGKNGHYYGKKAQRYTILDVNKFFKNIPQPIKVKVDDLPKVFKGTDVVDKLIKSIEENTFIDKSMVSQATLDTTIELGENLTKPFTVQILENNYRTGNLLLEVTQRFIKLQNIISDNQVTLEEPNVTAVKFGNVNWKGLAPILREEKPGTPVSMEAIYFIKQSIHWLDLTDYIVESNNYENELVVQSPAGISVTIKY